MHPYLLHGEGFDLPAYGLTIMIAFAVAIGFVHSRSERAGVDPDKLMAVYIAALICGLFGARALFILAVNPSGLADPSAWTASGGLAYYGAILGGLAGLIAVAVSTEIPLLKLLDLAAPGVVLALGVGRLGCFMAGCCNGAVMDVGPDAIPLLTEGSFLSGQIWLGSQVPFLALEFDRASGTVANITGQPLYPTQLWSAAAGLTVGALLSLLWERRRFDGQVVATMLIVEPVFRIVIEGFRADHRGVAVPLPPVLTGWLPGMSQAAGPGSHVAGLTTSQAIGLAMIVAGVALWVARRDTESSDLAV